MSISKIKVGSTEHDLHASKLTTARTITLSGDVSGSTTFDGSGNVTITTTVADDSHNHVISNVDGLQTALDRKLEMNTSGGIASCIAAGKYMYFKIATIKITNSYVNRPIVFEISSRGRSFSLVTIEFLNENNTDPGLSFFISNYDNCFYIKKTATSTWEVYGQYNEIWGDCTLHRITGCGAAGAYIDVTVNMTNIASLPSGCTQVVYGGNVGYATKATQDGNGNVITSTYATKTELTNGLNGKADSSHGTHVSYSTADPLMDGTASAGSANTVARSDHKHPTDTSRAAASDLNSHTGNTTVHITSTERTNWNAAKTHADSAHAPSNAEKNQNAFSNITVGSTTIAADSTTDTLTLVGSNVTITPDATNDKVTIGITKENVTNALGYTPPTTNTTYVPATQSVSGLMSADDKKKLDGIASGATKVIVDSALSSTSTNPVQNKVINSALAGKSNTGHTHDYIPTSQKGAANGLAELDSNGKVPSSQLPSYVDDVLEYSAKSSFPSTGESGKIYVDTSTNLTYRWSGSAYVEISPSLALGETSSTAYRGDRGKIAYDHSQTAHAPSNAEKNQNAFSNVVVGSTTIAADSATDTLTLVAGTNVTLTPDATNDKVTITASDSKVTQTAVTASDYTNWRPLIIGSSNSNTEGFSPSNVTDGVYAVNTITCQPSSGTIRATTFKGNASTATKLATARTIGLGTGATGTATSFDGSGNITIPVTSVKEAYLSWGGKNFYGSYGPIDAAMVPELGANRLAFIPASAVVIEYSRNSGSTWSTYSLSNENKINLFNGVGSGITIGSDGSTGINKSAYMVRVTINTRAANVYTTLNKFVIYCSTNGSSGCYCTIQGRLQSNYEAGTDTWTTFANKVDIAGWSGYNVVNTNGITTYGNTKTTQYGQVRFTFGTTGHSDTNYPGLSIIKIFGFGGAGWGIPSTMAKTGHMYTYDASQNVTFPAAVRANSFTENGTALSSKYAAKSHKHSVTAAGTNSSTSITPAGTVSQPTFTGTAASHNHTFTGTAAEHNHTFTGTQATASVKYTPAGTVSSSFTGTAHNHTFSGTAVTAGKDTKNVATVYSITGVGSLPSHSYTAPKLTGSVENQCLTLTFDAGSHSFSAGSLPERSSAISVSTANHTHSVTATGTIGNATAGGTVSSTFSGTEATISHTFTPAGNISKTSLTPAGTISSKELTPAGTVSKPTFTGTAASHTHTFTGSAVNSATES